MGGEGGGKCCGGSGVIDLVFNTLNMNTSLMKHTKIKKKNQLFKNPLREV